MKWFCSLEGDPEEHNSGLCKPKKLTLGYLIYDFY